ncbi:replication protein A 70 kDa DNA-binding subunit A-like [Quercus robur]|uniref:replication protein A 70 kDa DNA-binding subunit A-like n=1 Tax=Quercus robur TaxID=38942 RepID=UPI002162FCB1|nr:replication protein A 70 kDa DNA-binding subunit A-like [Quercus robur]
MLMLMHRLNTTIDVNIKEILPKRLPKVQDEELASQNKKIVVEIKNLEWNSETKDLMVTCNAKIININNKYEWYYVACLICKTKVKQVKGVLWCERCKNEPKFAVPSYRIQVQVQDETGSTTFILFDKGAEKIISKTAKELAEMQEEILKLDENILPKEIQKIIGNEYLFQLHLDEYNLKYGKENYTVSKILEMEISHKQNDSCKVEEHQDIVEEIVRKPKKDKYIAGQKIEIGETSVERPELTAPITIEDGRTGHKRMPLQMLQKRQKGTKQNESKKKKSEL